MKELTQFTDQKKLFEYLRENKDEIKSRKTKDLFGNPVLKFTSATSYTPPKVATKASEPVQADAKEIRVKTVANATRVLDSDMDVLMPGCYTRTIAERKGMMHHLHDHIHRMEAKVGQVADVYTEDVLVSDLLMDEGGENKTECLIFETDIKKSYNEKIFEEYKSGKVNQHSIGLQYVDIELAINDPDSEKEKALFDTYIDQIINPEKALERGFFWVVKDVEVLENSAVLWGSNPATPTLTTSAKDAPTKVKEEKSDADTTNRQKRFRKLKAI